MRVLMLTTHLRPGGVSAYTVSLANHLSQRGVRTFVASSGGEFSDRLERHVKVYPLKISTKCEFGFKVFSSLPRLCGILRSERIDLIHAQTRVAQVLGGLASRITFVPVVTTAHGYYNPGRISRRLFPFWGDGVIAVSDAVLEHMVQDFKVPAEKARRIYNGIELERYRNNEEGALRIRRSLEIPDGASVVGSVGRFSDVKGYVYLIEACRMLIDKGRDIYVLLAGEGKSEKDIRQRSRELGIEDKLRMVKPDTDISAYFFAIDIFCLPSLHEGLGLALMEAMASRRACVASDIGGLKELITDGKNGLLAKPGDAESLYRSIDALLRSDQLRLILSKNAKEKAFEEFGMKRCAEKTRTFYEEVLKRGRTDDVR